MTRRPLLVLGAFLAAVSLVAGCTSSGNGAAHDSTPPPSSVPASTTSPAATSTTTTTTTTTTVTSPTRTSPPPPVQSFPLNGMQVADLTFVGNQGWALGTAGCTRTSGRCSVLAHSSDNGRTWRSLTVPPGHVASGLPGESCRAPCVQHVRFATPKVGYLFGSGALYLTTDGGRSWHRQAGGADALESLSGNVIRVVDQGGCPPGCTYTVELSAIGSTHWQRVPLAAPNTTSTGVALARSGARAMLVVFGHPVGGAQNARSTRYISADDGRHWTKRGDPCPQSSGREVDSVALTSAPDGSFTVLCRGRSAGGTQFVATSTDGGAHFSAGGRSALGSGPVGALGAASARIILASSDDTYRSTDGGHHFARLSANGGSSPGPLGWLGFATSTVGHAISVDRRTIWTTTDAGRSWRAGRLH